MKLKVKLSGREDRYEKKFGATLIHGNIVLDNKTELPGCKGNYIQFVSGYSPIYSVESEGKVNTRIRYPAFRGSIGNNYLYCKLNWFERQKLSIITCQSWFHKHPVATFALIINTFFLIANLIFAYLNIKSNSKNIESHYLETLNKYIEYQNTQINLQNNQFEMLNEMLQYSKKDSVSN